MLKLTTLVTLVCLLLLILTMESVAKEPFDAVYLKDGSKIVGTIIEQVPNKSIKIRTRGGNEHVYTFDQIERITKEFFEEIPKDLMKESYTELGVNLGTPAGLNLALGNWFGRFGVRASGMVYGRKLNGIQGNLGFKLSDNINRSDVLAAIFGSLNIEKDNWSYFGLVYELNLSGFFFHAGLTAGSGSFSTPQLAVQLGYMHRFLPK